MAGEQITRDRQVELQGLLMGPGTPYSFHRFDPWLYPTVSVDDLGRPGRNGIIAGQDLLRDRRVPMEINIVTDGGKQAVIEARHRLVAAFSSPSYDVPLVFRAGDRTYRMVGRPRLADADLIKAPAGVGTVTARFLATDPRILDDVEQSGSTGFPDAGVGRTYDLVPPRVYGAPGSGGAIVAVNDGTTPAPWRVVIVGPWSNPTITNVTTGDQLRLAVNIGPGDELRLDSTDQSILLGTAHRLSAVLPGSVWPTLEPGANELRFGGASGSGSAVLYWRSAWI